MDLVGLSEVAEIAGVSRQAVVNWRARFSDFPPPVAELASGPVWTRDDIDNWLKTREGQVEKTIDTTIDSGNKETRNLDIKDFDRVEAGSAFEVEIHRAPTYSVAITASDSVFRDLDINKSGSTLRLRFRPRFPFWHSGRHAAVIGMPDLRGMHASGATHVAVNGFDTASPLEIQASGASEVRLDGVKAGETRITASGASHVTGKLEAGDTRINASGASGIGLTGTGGNIKAEASGASRVELPGFKSANADVKLSGASRAAVALSGRLDLKASGASRLTYTGEGTLGTVETSGASSIERR